MFPRCFIFLEIFHCCFHIWRSRHLLHFLLMGFGREKPSFSPFRDPDAFPELVYEYACSRLLVSSLRGGPSWRIVRFLSIMQSQAQADRPPVHLSWSGAEGSGLRVCSHSVFCRVRSLSGGAHWWSAEAHSRPPGAQLRVTVWTCVQVRCETVEGGGVCQVGGSAGEVFQEAHWWASWWYLCRDE